eukprot:TRINITY_DN5424_c0_g2_i1.p1 TRINITY_DN5424_c0_g2~~TRINITY_DN5424_c0_g2_i1.p1  ORF type:complete len:1069 (+),score=164.37 TRINITY_DN5424_c0_g2_i1:62-3268(+)
MQPLSANDNDLFTKFQALQKLIDAIDATCARKRRKANIDVSYAREPKPLLMLTDNNHGYTEQQITPFATSHVGLLTPAMLPIEEFCRIISCLGDDALIISRMNNIGVILYVSTSLRCADLRQKAYVLLAWDVNRRELLPWVPSPHESLRWMTSTSPYNSEQRLLQNLADIRVFGTRICIFNLKNYSSPRDPPFPLSKTVIEKMTSPLAASIPQSPAGHTSLSTFQRFAEVMHFKTSLLITIQKEKVQARILGYSLCETEFSLLQPVDCPLDSKVIIGADLTKSAKGVYIYHENLLQEIHYLPTCSTSLPEDVNIVVVLQSLEPPSDHNELCNQDAWNQIENYIQTWSLKRERRQIFESQKPYLLQPDVFWVRCTAQLCMKWRCLGSDPLELIPHGWHCSLNRIEEEKDCNKAEAYISSLDVKIIESHFKRRNLLHNPPPQVNAEPKPIPLSSPRQITSRPGKEGLSIVRPKPAPKQAPAREKQIKEYSSSSGDDEQDDEVRLTSKIVNPAEVHGVKSPMVNKTPVYRPTPQRAFGSNETRTFLPTKNTPPPKPSIQNTKAASVTPKSLSTTSKSTPMTSNWRIVTSRQTNERQTRQSGYSQEEPRYKRRIQVDSDDSADESPLNLDKLSEALHKRRNTVVHLPKAFSITTYLRTLETQPDTIHHLDSCNAHEETVQNLDNSQTLAADLFLPTSHGTVLSPNFVVHSPPHFENHVDEVVDGDELLGVSWPSFHEANPPTGVINEPIHEPVVNRVHSHDDHDDQDEIFALDSENIHTTNYLPEAHAHKVDVSRISSPVCAATHSAQDVQNAESSFINHAIENDEMDQSEEHIPCAQETKPSKDSSESISKGEQDASKQDAIESMQILMNTEPRDLCTKIIADERQIGDASSPVQQPNLYETESSHHKNPVDVAWKENGAHESISICPVISADGHETISIPQEGLNTLTNQVDNPIQAHNRCDLHHDGGSQTSGESVRPLESNIVDLDVDPENLQSTNITTKIDDMRSGSEVSHETTTAEEPQTKQLDSSDVFKCKPTVQEQAVRAIESEMHIDGVPIQESVIALEDEAGF